MGTAWHFVPDRVWITDGERRVIDQRSDPRASFAGHTARPPGTSCNRLTSQAMQCGTNLNTPFLFTLPGFEVREIEPHQKTAKAGDVCSQIPARHSYSQRVPSRREQHSSLMKRGFCSGSITWPSVQPPTVASITRPSKGLSSPHFAGSSAPGPRVNAPTSVLLQIPMSW